MNFFILDDKLINKNQITKITYNMKYHEEPEMEIYDISEFKFVCINNEKIEIYLMKDKKLKRDKTISYDFENKEEYLLEKAKLKNAKRRPKNIKNHHGYVKAFIELSSGTVHETTICNFKDMYKINSWDIVYYYEKIKEGIKFNPDEINIEFVCDIIFQNNKQFKKQKVIT
jgi:hypothetical protein